MVAINVVKFNLFSEHFDLNNKIAELFVIVLKYPTKPTCPTPMPIIFCSNA